MLLDVKDPVYMTVVYFGNQSPGYTVTLEVGGIPGGPYKLERGHQVTVEAQKITAKASAPADICAIYHEKAH